jgi:hypothetical protein
LSNGRAGFSYGAEGRLGATGLKVVTPNGYQVTAADAQLEGVRVKTTDRILLRAFTVQGLNVARHVGSVAPSSGPEVLAAERVRARDVVFSDKTDLQVQSIVAEGARANFLSKDNIFSGPHRLFDDGDTASVGFGTPIPPRGKRKLNIRIVRVDITKGSIIALRDESMAPAFVNEWRLDEAYAEDIDSLRPNKPMRIRLAGKNRGYGSFEVHGLVNPFSAPLDLAMDARIDRIDLPNLTPYLSRHAGYVFKSGEGNLQAKIRIDKGRLDAQSILTLRAMEVDPTSADAASAAVASLSMPVEAALSLLRDKNNDIRLEIPVTGDPLNPQFSFSKVLAQAAAGAIKTASMSFLKYALQPYGAALLMGELAQNFAASIRLDPVVFGPGKSTLEASYVDYLARVAKTLAERPALRIKLCGKATANDRVALAAQGKVVVGEIKDQVLAALAVARASAIKQHLVRRYEIDPGRIIACRPQVDLAPGAMPRAEFLI